MKKILLTSLAALVTATATAPSLYRAENLYSLSTTVTAINESDDTVICTDFNGNEWEFYGIEDWEIGDIAALTMYDNCTAEIADDEIIRATYCGWNC